MRLSRKSEYACLALIELSKRYPGNFVKIETISNTWSIPRKFLEQILVTMKNAGYLKSRKGAEGGYSLSRSPENITLAEIVRLIDGALAPVESASTFFYGASPIEQYPPLIKVFKDIRDFVSNKLENITFLDLINQK